MTLLETAYMITVIHIGITLLIFYWIVHILNFDSSYTKLTMVALVLFYFMDW